MRDYNRIAGELKDYLIGTTDSVVPEEQKKDLYYDFINRFPDIETIGDVDEYDFQQFIADICNSGKYPSFYRLDENDVGGTGLVPQYVTNSNDYYYEDDSEELHKVIKNDDGEWVEAD